MTRTEIVIGMVSGLLSGLLATEMGDWSPWLAHRMVTWYARQRHRENPARAQIRAEELQALIDERPGKMSKLLTGVAFAGRAVPAALHHTVRRARGRARPGAVRRPAAGRLAAGLGKGLQLLAAASLVIGVISAMQSGVSTAMPGYFILPALIVLSVHYSQYRRRHRRRALLRVRGHRRAGLPARAVVAVRSYERWTLITTQHSEKESEEHRGRILR